jgi:HlyD family secretion protein
MSRELRRHDQPDYFPAGMAGPGGMRNGAVGATKAVITELRPLGTFATWQAERVISDHDRNTLRLRLDPEGEPAGFEPGMTVWIGQ